MGREQYLAELVAAVTWIKAQVPTLDDTLRLLEDDRVYTNKEFATHAEQMAENIQKKLHDSTTALLTTYQDNLPMHGALRFWRHDINNPFTPILGALYLIHSSDLPLVEAEKNKYQERILASVARIEGAFQVDTFTDDDLRRIASSLPSIYPEGTWKAEGVTVIYDKQEVAPVPLVRTLVARMALNLLLNARKAKIDDTTALEITVRTYREQGYGVFEVGDNGTGISVSALRSAADPTLVTRYIRNPLQLALELGVSGYVQQGKPGTGDGLHGCSLYFEHISPEGKVGIETVVREGHELARYMLGGKREVVVDCITGTKVKLYFPLAETL
jgi:signal transduction histidine kinase